MDINTYATPTIDQVAELTRVLHTPGEPATLSEGSLPHGETLPEPGAGESWEWR